MPSCHISTVTRCRTGAARIAVTVGSLLVSLLIFGTTTLASASAPGSVQAPFTVSEVPYADGKDVIRTQLDPGIYTSLATGSGQQIIEVPLPGSESVLLELERFEITTGQTRFVLGGSAGDQFVSGPELVFLRGSISGEPSSRAFLAISSTGITQGYVTNTQGGTRFISTSPQQAALGWDGIVVISSEPMSMDLPDGVAICGLDVPADFRPVDESERLAAGDPRLRLGHVALDSDQEYYDIFGNPTAAYSYAITLMAAVSDIYIRDVNMKLIVDYIRLWPTGGEPFDSGNLGSVANYWSFNEDPTPYNVVHLLSGRRDLSFGGVAYLGGTCSGEAAYSIAGFLNGGFPNPVDLPSNAAWDLIVSAHEIGHNCGTLHTHDGYTPTIDDCGNGTPSRGTIMSYCHIHVGYTSMTDLNFHRRVQEVIEAEFETFDCFGFDCNGNNIADEDDISSGASDDDNANGVPDECEDCNANGTLDPQDIAFGTSDDVNSNGIPDECETDCDGNDLPDEWEIANSPTLDENGNNILDSCDPDCNSNGFPDFLDIELGLSFDFDRNTIPDDCEDCDNNGIPDWIDLERQGNLFVANLEDYVREFHEASGYPIINYVASGGGGLGTPYDVVIDDSRNLYTAGFSASQIYKHDLATGTGSLFVASVPSPSGLTIGPNGNLFVSSQGADEVIEIDITTGAQVSVFVVAGSGGLSDPYGLIFGPDGHLYVVSGGNNSVLKYDGTTGTSMGAFVSSGSGGLSAPRQLLFDSRGELLVTSSNTNQVLRYDGANGSSLGQFNDLQSPSQPWGIAMRPNGHIFVAEHSLGGGAPRVIEFFPDGRYYRRFVRGDNSGLQSNTGLAFAPPSSFDCNQNGVIDACDISSGQFADVDQNGILDICESADSDGDGVPDGIDNCSAVANANQSDYDDDGVGDACDNCIRIDNSAQFDNDGDGAGNACDNCLFTDNPDQIDSDGDLAGDACDVCPDDPLNDQDDDGFCAGDDNCPELANPGQEDSDSDGIGDLCDDCPNDNTNDVDGDNVCGDVDNCPSIPNPNQDDGDGDQIGNACDNCPSVPNPGQEDENQNGIGDVCDYICGDSDGNGQVAISDAVYIVTYIFGGGPSPDPIEAADANCDGGVSVTDAVFIISYIFGGGPAPCSSCP